uniref:ATP synthase F0 subunit 8 n=1 Tax=Lumbriclymenella robusta TaxID=3138170 RepID=A0AB38ZG01_9ANNE
MPHLAPLPWAIAPLMFFSLLLLVQASLWWHQSPTFPKLSDNFQYQQHPYWTWN